MLVPIDQADAYEAALKALPPEDRVRYVVHDVGKHETLPMIAKRYGTSAAVIAKLNGLPAARVTPGESLKIPEIGARLPDKVLIAAARIDQPETDEGGRKQHQIVYRVRAGDTLFSIARRNNMPVSALAQLNNMGSSDALVTGQRLVIKASARHVRDEGVRSGRRVVYTVRHGDTVVSISHRFQVSVAQLKSWNGINQHHGIRAGRRVVLYVDAKAQQG
jgi:membrane-bound lytic murein transglycosylase D